MDPEQFQAVVNKAPDAIFQPLWNFCSGSDGAVNGAELATCGQTIGNFVGMSGDNQNFLYEFGEFKAAIAALAGSNARVALKNFDSDKDGLLNAAEQTALYNYVIAVSSQWGYHVTDAQWAALKAAFGKATGGKAAASTFDIAIFEILAGNVFLN